MEGSSAANFPSESVGVFILHVVNQSWETLGDTEKNKNEKLKVAYAGFELATV